jgi:hypothetical protein
LRFQKKQTERHYHRRTGSWKTALVEGFAIEITKGNVPEMLKNGTLWNWTPEPY